MFLTCFFSRSGDHRDLHSFPTRRSSDLLVRRFGGFTAVNDVTFRVEKGEIFGFLGDRKSTRLNSSHLGISYAVFCLKKKRIYNSACLQASTSREHDTPQDMERHALSDCT